MASADFCIARIASSLTPLALSDGQCRPPGIRHTSFIWRDMDLLLLLRLGIGLCFVWQTYPHKSLISIFCSCPPNFVLDFLHPHPHGHKLVFDYLIPPNWLTGDLHSRCCVMSCVPKSERHPKGCLCYEKEKSRRRPTLARSSPALPSAKEPLTSVFGMGTGVTTPLWPPAKNRLNNVRMFECLNV